MEDLSLHILDIAENSVTAGAKNIEIGIREDMNNDLLTLEITDDGKGLRSVSPEKAADPFQTTRTTRKVGLGLALLKQSATESNGALHIAAQPQRGTRVTATFQLSHIDRKPLGNIAETIITLIAGWPAVDIVFRHERDGLSLLLDTKELKRLLGDMPLNSPAALDFIRRYLHQEEESLYQ